MMDTTVQSAAEIEQERVIIAMVKKHITEARSKKLTGNLVIDIEFRDGGLGGRWISTRYRDK